MVQRGRYEGAPPFQAFAAHELDRLQLTVARDEPSDATLVEADPGHRQSTAPVVVQIGGSIAGNDHVVGPAAQHQRHVHGAVARGEYRERLIAGLPAVAERAVEH